MNCPLCDAVMKDSYELRIMSCVEDSHFAIAGKGGAAVFFSESAPAKQWSLMIIHPMNEETMTGGKSHEEFSTAKELLSYWKLKAFW